MAKNDDDEIDLKAALTRLLEDSSIHDVTLKGSDGVEVSACRGMLAARSDVFKAMLFGKFAESTQKVVQIKEYKGEVVRAIVEYIHTNTTSTFSGVTKKRKHDENADAVVDRVHTLVSTAAAALYFNLPKLAEKTKHNIENLLYDEPVLSFQLLDFCQKQGPPVMSGELSSLALKHARQRTRGHVSSSEAVTGLSLEVVETILNDDKMEWTEFDFFEFLKAWAGADASRKSVATGLVKAHLSLAKICPTKLSSVVKSSGLVDTTQLMEAYEEQSLAHVNGQSPMGFRVPRYVRRPVWSSSASDSTETGGTAGTGDLLNCAPMVSGVHQWTVKVLEVDTCLHVGIGAAGVDFEAELLGLHRGGWALNNKGQPWWEGSFQREPVSGSFAMLPGDNLTFSLDLRPNEAENGSLRMSKQSSAGGEEGSYLIVSNLRNKLVDFPDGFLPAVSSIGVSRFRLSDFKILQ